MASREKIIRLTYILGLLGMVSCFLFFIRDHILGCHDTLAEYVYALTENFTESFDRAFSFCISRGRLGIVFPFVVSLRQAVMGTGNLFLVRLIHHLPVLLNVALFSYIIAKRTRLHYGLFYAVIFIAFFQTNVWHSIIDCYPLDFMYGLFTATVSVLLFLRFLSKGRRTVFLVLSLFLYYESLQAYEPFIFTSLIYGYVVILYSVKKDRKIRTFIRTILPHFIVSVVYMATIVLVHKYPIMGKLSAPIDHYGTAEGFLRTMKVFSLGMFPMTHTVNLGGDYLFRGLILDRGALLFSAFSGIAAASFVILSVISYRKEDKESKKKINRELLMMAGGGFIFAVSFPVSHALMENYQIWVMTKDCGGYVTTGVCYFGWILFLTCLASFVLNLLSDLRYRKAVIIILSIAACLAIGTGAGLTRRTNEYFDSEHASTGRSLTVKAKAFDELLRDIASKGERYDIIYVPQYEGINGNMSLNGAYASYILGYDIRVEKEVPQSINGEKAIVFIYDENSRSGYVAEEFG